MTTKNPLTELDQVRVNALMREIDDLSKRGRMYASIGGKSEADIRRVARQYNDRIAVLRTLVGNRVVDRLEKTWLYGPTGWTIIVGQEWEAVVHPESKYASVALNKASAKNSHFSGSKCAMCGGALKLVSRRGILDQYRCVNCKSVYSELASSEKNPGGPVTPGRHYRIRVGNKYVGVRWGTEASRWVLTGLSGSWRGTAAEAERVAGVLRDSILSRKSYTFEDVAKKGWVSPNRREATLPRRPEIPRQKEVVVAKFKSYEAGRFAMRRLEYAGNIWTAHMYRLERGGPWKISVLKHHEQKARALLRGIKRSSRPPEGLLYNPLKTGGWKGWSIRRDRRGFSKRVGAYTIHVYLNRGKRAPNIWTWEILRGRNNIAGGNVKTDEIARMAVIDAFKTVASQ